MSIPWYFENACSSFCQRIADLCSRLRGHLGLQGFRAPRQMIAHHRRVGQRSTPMLLTLGPGSLAREDLLHLFLHPGQVATLVGRWTGGRALRWIK